MDVSKQSKPIARQCQSRAQCFRDATWGVYAWVGDESDVNLDRPVKVFCGQHKPRLQRSQLLRNVRVWRG